MKSGQPSSGPRFVKEDADGAGVGGVIRDGSIYYTQDRNSANVFWVSANFETGDISGELQRVTDQFPGVRPRTVFQIRVENPVHKIQRWSTEPGVAVCGAGARRARADCLRALVHDGGNAERAAVQERLTDVYLNHLTSLQRQVTSFWQCRQAALKSAGHDSSAQIFATLVRANLADSVVVYDDSWKALYPSAAVPGTPLEESGDWVLAKELEFQKKDYAAAAAAYSRIADLRPGSAAAATTRARAMQSQASCLLNAGQKAQALRCLEALASDPSLQESLSTQGTLIVPNAQLLILKLSHDATNKPDSSRREEALTSKLESENLKSQIDQSLLTSAATIKKGNSRGTEPSDSLLDLQRRTRDSLLQ